MKSSGRNQPCPACQRTKDSDCRWNDETILCHTGTDFKSGDTITIDGAVWAFIHHNGGFSGSAAVFKPHRERSRDQWRRDIQRRTPRSPSELISIQTQGTQWADAIEEFHAAFQLAWDIPDLYSASPDQLQAASAAITDAQARAAALRPHLSHIWREHKDLEQLHRLRIESNLKSLGYIAEDLRQFQQNELGIPCPAAVYEMAEDI